MFSVFNPLAIDLLILRPSLTEKPENHNLASLKRSIPSDVTLLLFSNEVFNSSILSTPNNVACTAEFGDFALGLKT